MGSSQTKYDLIDELDNSQIDLIDLKDSRLFEMINNYPSIENNATYEDINNYVSKCPEILNELSYYSNWYKCPIDSQKLSSWRVSPIFVAIKCKSYKLVKLFIDLGADVNIRAEPYNHTPLMCAAMFGSSLEITKLLLASGANLNDTTTNGLTAIMLSAIHSSKLKSKLIFDFLLNQRDIHISINIFDVIIKTSRSCNIDIDIDVINSLIRKGYIHNDKDKILNLLLLQNASK